uniref:Uncharacterized protein n=1 Tax=Timema monikensis TaxID=170555 RepID=A0A7R9EGV7_9NEOP|nr:unnamed protein product [Timema monikensis]
MTPSPTSETADTPSTSVEQHIPSNQEELSPSTSTEMNQHNELILITKRREIKTNGSLPRDKRLGSPGALMADGETSLDIFTFDTNNTSGCSSTEPSVSSPNTNTLTTPVSSQSEVSMGCSPYENVVVTSPGCVFYPQSPRTRIKTILSSGSKEAVQRETLDFASSNDYDFITLHPPQKQSESTSSVSRQSEHVAPESSFSPVRRSSDRDKFILPLGNKTADPSGGPDRGASSKLADGLQTRQRNSEDIMNYDHNGVTNWEHYNRRKVSVDEIDQLRKERGKLMAAMSGLKRKLADIGQQEEELLREVGGHDNTLSIG